MEKRKQYYLGFYRDYYSKRKPIPLVCQVTDNLDSLSCELLGGKFPLIELFSTPNERNITAHEVAKQNNATHLEIGNYPRKKMKC